MLQKVQIVFKRGRRVYSLRSYVLFGRPVFLHLLSGHDLVDLSAAPLAAAASQDFALALVALSISLD
jgi:hypothetical protein